MRQTGKIAGIAILYVLAARLGLQLDALSGFATLVWPPTGISLAALLLGGYWLWPGIFIGAFVANALTGAPLLVAAGIATGNSLEALLGAYALRQLPDLRLSLDRVRDAVAFILLSAGLATVVSATIGVASLSLGGIVGPGHTLSTWRAWWLGDAIGALLVAPAILIWATRPLRMPPTRRLLEASALTVSVAISSLVTFVVPAARSGGLFDHAYLFFPFLIWAAIRFGQRGAVSTTLLVSIIAVWGTAMGEGPFVHSTLHDSLFALQTFMGVTAATFLVLGASTSERERARNDLSAAHDVAARANRAKADFLAVMSHELRTPLNAIAGYAEILGLEVTGPLTKQQADAVNRIQRSQHHLLGLIDDVLSFAKIEAGANRINAVPVRVSEAFDELGHLLQPELLRKGLKVERDAAETAFEVQADPAKMRQILLNIVGNSIKFTSPGGRIRLTASRDGDVVTMTITDTGIGVPPDKLAQIFDPFFQVDAGTTREYPGVGLGLAIARDLARAMGGDIRFDSTLGQGSAVSLILPSASVD